MRVDLHEWVHHQGGCFNEYGALQEAEAVSDQRELYNS